MTGLQVVMAAEVEMTVHFSFRISLS